MHKSKKELVLDKITDAEVLGRLCEGWRVKGHKIVFTNGCFDLLHAGHIHVLLEAANLGQKFIVGLNTDASVKRLKGEHRPVYSQDVRALLLAAQLYVDAVVLFDRDTPAELLRAVRPDVLVKGGDYTAESVVGYDFVKSYGGEVVIIPTIEGFSTSAILQRIK